MKAAVVRSFDRPLEIEELPTPEPEAGQVLVRIETCGLCHTDIHAARGEWPVKPSPPFVPGHEGVGVIERLGTGEMYGLEPGMPIYQALRRCPDLVLLPPRYGLYRRAAQALERILHPYVPIIEPHTLGHAYGDLSGTYKLFGPATDIAARIRREIWGRLGLPVTVGLAANKVVSEVAAHMLSGTVLQGLRYQSLRARWPVDRDDPGHRRHRVRTTRASFGFIGGEELVAPAAQIAPARRESPGSAIQEEGGKPADNVTIPTFRQWNDA